MKKWFKDDTLETQTLTEEAARKLFGVPEAALADTLTHQCFVVLRTIRTGTHSIQIAFNTLASLANNRYYVFAFDAADELCWMNAYPSHTAAPLVWDRLFGGMDYLDWLSVQHQLKREPIFANLEIDTDPAAPGILSFYFTQEKPDEIAALLVSGKGYHPICVFADRRPDLVANAKAWIEREYAV